MFIWSSISPPLLKAYNKLFVDKPYTYAIVKKKKGFKDVGFGGSNIGSFPSMGSLS